MRGPLKTKSSAGIPGYLENYLFAEKLTMRRRALETEEVANTVAFLFKPPVKRHQRPRDRGERGDGLELL